jgi:cytochrome c
MRDVRRLVRYWPALLVLAAIPFGFAVTPAPAVADDAMSAPGYLVRYTDPERGKDLFTGKGCVVCHAINGVGGKAGPALDAANFGPHQDVFDFAARMLRGAPLMLVLQEMELGYQIGLTGQELADIARFIHDAEAQKSFSKSDVPELIQDWMVDEVYDAFDIEGMAQ